MVVNISNIQQIYTNTPTGVSQLGNNTSPINNLTTTYINKMAGMVGDSGTILWGSWRGASTEFMNGFIKETIIYTEPKNNDFLQKITT